MLEATSISCASLSDIAKVIFENTSSSTYINIKVDAIGIDSPDKLFFFLVNIVHEGLLIVCNSQVVTMEHMNIVKSKIEAIGVQMFVETLPKNENSSNTSIVMGLCVENDKSNLRDYKLLILYPTETYKIYFDFPNKFKFDIKCKAMVT